MNSIAISKLNIIRELIELSSKNSLLNVKSVEKIYKDKNKKLVYDKTMKLSRLLDKGVVVDVVVC